VSKWAAEKGHLDCLKYLHETAKAPLSSGAVRVAHENNHPECLQYLLDNDCPLPLGWSYEDGELYSSSSEEEEGDIADWEEGDFDPEYWEEVMEEWMDEWI